MNWSVIMVVGVASTAYGALCILEIYMNSEFYNARALQAQFVTMALPFLIVGLPLIFYAWRHVPKDDRTENLESGPS
jgi:hypothetical protein